MNVNQVSELEQNVKKLSEVRRYWLILNALYPRDELSSKELKEKTALPKSAISDGLSSLEMLRIITVRREKRPRGGQDIPYAKLTEYGKKVYAVITEKGPKISKESKREKVKQEEVKMCLEVLEVSKDISKENDVEGEKSRFNELKYNTSYYELETYLKLGHWDTNLETYYIDKVFENPEAYDQELFLLLSEAKLSLSQGEESPMVDFIQRKKDDVFKLLLNIRRKGKLAEVMTYGSQVLPFVYGQDLLQKLMSALDSNPKNVADIIFTNAKDLYEKNGQKFKELLYRLLDHKNEDVRMFAVNAIKETADVLRL